MNRSGIYRINITPPVGIGLAGMGKGHIAKDVHDNLFATSLYLEDAHEAICIVACDLLGIDIEITKKVKEILKEKINPENLVIAASHTHYGPSTRFILPYPEVNKKYIEELCEKISFSVLKAREKSKKVKIGYGNGFMKGIVNRRIIFPDGRYYNYYEHPELLKFAKGICDYEIGVVYFSDLRDIPLSLLFNYTCHPIFLPIDTSSISADYPGVAKKTIENEIGCIPLFTNGALGNIGPINGLKGYKKMEEFGVKLGRKVVEVMKKIKLMKGLKIQMKSKLVKIPVRKRIANKWNMNERVKDKKFIEIEIKVFSIGRCAFVGIPGEPFVELGLEIKEKSPFDFTYIIALTNDDILYIPDGKAYKEGGYEVSVALCGKRSYDIIVKNSLKILNSLYRNL